MKINILKNMKKIVIKQMQFIPLFHKNYKHKALCKIVKIISPEISSQEFSKLQHEL